MKILQAACILCIPLTLDAACGTVACVPGNNIACSMTCVSVTLPDTTALYENNAAVIGNTPPTQTIDFENIQPDQVSKQTFPFTVGTFNPNGNVTIAATDSSKQANFVLISPSSSSQIPFTVEYEDCAGTTTDISNNNTVTLLPSHASMVLTSGLSTGTAPCHPYLSVSAPGAGAGQLTFTIPAVTPGNEPGGGTYTDTVSLLVTADN